MSTILAAPVNRQAAVLVAIATLHVGAFLVLSAGLGVHLVLPQIPSNRIFVVPPPARPAVEQRPDPVEAADFHPEAVEAPEVIFTVVDGQTQVVVSLPSVRSQAGGAPITAAAEYSGPTLRTRDARLQALIDACYPTAARRLGREGRGTARVVVATTGRVRSWSVELSTGFSELDPGMGCVARRVQFKPARRDGQAVAATAVMPIVFRLD